MDSFRKNILECNTQLTESGLRVVNAEALRARKLQRIVVVGLGGSGLAGALLEEVAHEVGLKVPITIWKSYGLPPLGTLENPLIIFVSFSGNTLETVSGLRALLARPGGRKNVAVITTGGILESLARRARLPLLIFPAGTLTPRQSIGRMFYGLVNIIRRTGLSLNVPSYIALRPKSFEIHGQALAQKLRGRLVLIYTDEAHKALGYIWKIKLNETAKILAFANILPEADHNELVAFENLRTKTASLFLDDASLPRALERQIALTKKLMRARGATVLAIPLKGKTNLEKAWRTTMLADWTSYHLAKLYRVDPEKTKIIDRLKTLLQ